MPYSVEVSGEAEGDLDRLTGAQEARARQAFKRYLRDQPTQEGNIRRPLDPNPLSATWELRLDDVRVCYEVDEENQTVYILRVLTKIREQYYLRGRPFEMRLP